MKKIRKIFFVIGVILLMAAISVSAAPINGLEQTLTQPNGREIIVYSYGDEFYSYMTDSEGNVIVENPETGYYVYATLLNNSIVHTNVVYETDILEVQSLNEDIDYLKADEIPENIFLTAFENSALRQKEVQEKQLETASLVSNYESFNDFELNNIVVFVRFSNKNFTKTAKTFYESLFSTNRDSLKNYYEETSYGKLCINSQMYPQSSSSQIITYTDPHNISYYTETASGYDRWEREDELVSNVMNYVASYIPPELDLDKNNDGDIDMITIILAGSTAYGENQIRWPHQTYYTGDEIIINGSEVYDYNIQVENALSATKADDGSSTFQKGSDILIHETLHILGLPDLYYANFFTNGVNDVSTMGEWDVMSKGQGVHMCAYLKQQYCNWIDIPEIKTDGNYSLQPLSEGGNCAYMLRSPKDDNEYFVIEYRRKTGEFESAVPSDRLVIYRVLADHRGEGNVDASSRNGTDDEIRQIYAKSSGSCSLKFSNGVSSGITISNINISGNNASFNVTFPTTKNLFYFKDRNLANVICDSLGKTESQITENDLRSMETLTIPARKYSDMPYDLSGVENLTGLKTLIANDCGIDEISMLSSLINLERLELNNNYISDISALTNLVNLKILKLRGNMIDDYSSTSTYYSYLTTKDFSLGDKNDAVFCVPNIENGSLGTIKMVLSSTRPTKIYYSLEKYDKDSGKIVKRQRGSVNASLSTNQKSIDVPEVFGDDEDSYIVLKIYENKTYRHLMSETIVDGIYFDLSSWQGD